MAQGPYGIDPGEGGFTLEPQGMPVHDFFPGNGWGPQVPFGPGGGPGPVPGGGPGPGPVPWGLPMYPTDLDAGRLPAAGIAPPLACPQPCPVTVRADLCAPQGPQKSWDTDPFGDPRSFIPPGVRTVPEYTPTGVKTGTGQTTLVGPGGSFVFPTPQLPSTPKGTAVASGEVVGVPGAVELGPEGYPVNALGVAPRRRIPWWIWLAAGVVAWRAFGR